MRSILIFWAFLAQIMFCCIVLNATASSSTFIPWSGYWWPYNFGGLATGYDYRGSPAPLEKYLLFTTGRSSGPLISWYKSKYYDPSAVEWSGLCIYWARAAMMETYDILPSSEDNMVFRVGDKKGLLTLCHDGDMMVRSSGLDPVEFHRWLIYYIGEKKTSFTADLDFGDEIWIFPIYRYEMSSAKNGLVESVTVKIYYASDDVHPDYIGTAERRATYTYDLFLNSSGDIIGGEYTGNSVRNCPDALAYPLNSAAQCPYIDCDTVKRIARSKDDYLEVKNNKAVRILPGFYNLILLNEDQYVLNGLAGDEVLIEIVKDDSSEEEINIDISNKFGELMSNHKLSNGSLIAQFTMEDPPYVFTFSQKDYKDPNIYSLAIDQITAYHQHIPFIPKSGEWIGFAITNASDEVAKDVILTTCSGDGRPLQTVFDPVSLQPHEKRMFGFDSLPWRIHEYSKTDSLILMSNSPVSMVNLFAQNQQAMAGFSEAEAAGQHVIIPDIFDESTSPFMKGAVINETFDDAEVVFRLYSTEGELISEIDGTIPPSGKYDINPGQSPFNRIPEGGWVDIVSTNTTQLTGYQYLKNKRGKKDVLDTLFALPVAAGKKYVPHITEPMGRWNTFLTLINPNNKINSIKLHPSRAGSDVQEDVSLDLDPFEKRIIDLSSEFGKIEGDPLYHSILAISGKYPVAGYYTYSPSKGGDNASYPLLDEQALKTELVMPHHAGGDGQWWTGVGICNPNQIPVQVLLTPYDLNGEAMEELVETVELPGGAYDVFNVGMKYSEDASDIAYMKIKTVNPDGELIGGFYLYGNQNNKEYGVVKSLSGANM